MFGPCLRCRECEAGTECDEHSRLCFAWRQPAVTFVAGSVVTGVSSACNVAEYNIGKYKELVEKLGDTSVEIKSILDRFPAGADQQRNDSFSSSRRERDITNEDEQLMIIETLLGRYKEQRERLRELASDEEETPEQVVVRGVEEGLQPDDPVSPVAAEARFGLMTETNTRNYFETQRVAFEGLGVEVLGPDLNQLEDDGSWDALGIARIPGGSQEEVERTPAHPVEVQVQIRTEEDVPKVAVPVSVSAVEQARTVSTTASEILDSRPVVAKVSEPSIAVSMSASTASRMSVTEISVTAMTTSDALVSKPATASIVASTVTTTSTRTTPSATPASSLSSQAGSRDPPRRRRSTSEGEEEPHRPRTSEAKSARLSQAKLLVANRTQALSQDLATLMSRIMGSTSSSTGWAENEVGRLVDRLDKLEEIESEVWMLTAALDGRPAQRKRIDRGNEWVGRQRDRVRKIKDKSWELGQARNTGTSAGDCRHSHGHLEKVKLPTFSGKQEEFSEFRNQFRELCRGERYTPILEMAQLKLKLPREALTMIAGLQCPDAAWIKLEELYGHRELSIMSALKNLREFKSAKQAAHKQVIEITMAVQKCKTELNNIDAIRELLGDRETLACVIQSLPSTVRDKWYDRKVPSDTIEKGEFLFSWLEEQRENSIRVRLDMMAAKMRGGNTATSSSKPNVSSESTDKGLFTSAHHASESTSRADPAAADKPIGDRAARVDVKTLQDAQTVAAQRKTGLEARKLDKCPVCGTQHTYERTWAEVKPPVKVKLLSTHLTTCAKFLALPPEAKLAAVVGNAACLQCAALDHSEHKYPGRKEGKEPKCTVQIDGAACGGRHGRWYHEGVGSGAAHSVIATASSHGPGLYEVYKVPVHPPEGSPSSRSADGMVMIDPGADTNFIRNDFARQLEIPGEPCQ